MINPSFIVIMNPKVVLFVVLFNFNSAVYNWKPATKLSSIFSWEKETFGGELCWAEREQLRTLARRQILDVTISLDQRGILK